MGQQAINLREERIQELTDLIAARMPPRRIELAAPPPERFEWYAANCEALEPIKLDQTPTARAVREIGRLAARYPWGAEVIRRAMDRQAVATPEELTADAIYELRDELRKLDQCAQFACDLDDLPPAR